MLALNIKNELIKFLKLLCATCGSQWFTSVLRLKTHFHKIFVPNMLFCGTKMMLAVPFTAQVIFFRNNFVP